MRIKCNLGYVKLKTVIAGPRFPLLVQGSLCVLLEGMGIHSLQINEHSRHVQMHILNAYLNNQL